MTDQPIILAPSAEAKVALRCDFAVSSAAWHADAALADLAGNHARAATLRAVAAIAGAVSRGGGS